MSILLTGGAGFIGSNVANYLKGKGKNIIVLDKLDICSNLKNLEEGITFIKGDICNSDLVNHILQEYKIDVVMHFAAETHVDNSFGNSIKFTISNVLGTHTLLECAKNYGKLQKFIHVSTDEVFGEQSHHSNTPSTENSNLEPTNPYAATKASAEHIVNSYHISFRIPTIITRSNNIFGARQFPEKLIPKFTTLLSRNEICELHGDGTQLRSYLYIDDVCTAFELILEKGEIGKVYNIGSELETKNIEVWKYLMQIFRKEYPQYLAYANDDHYIRYVADRNFNDRRYWMDCEEIKKLGWKQQRTDFYETLRTVVSWYLRNPQHWENLGTALNTHQIKK